MQVSSIVDSKIACGSVSICQPGDLSRVRPTLYPSMTGIGSSKHTVSAYSLPLTVISDSNGVIFFSLFVMSIEREQEGQASGKSLLYM